MTRMVYKQCSCGLYHDINITACSCGRDLSAAEPAVVEGELPAEKVGQIDPSLVVYEQKCSHCGKVHYLLDASPDGKIRKCTQCNRSRIASMKPVEFLRQLPDAPADPMRSNIADALTNQVSGGVYEEPTQTPGAVSDLVAMQRDIDRAVAQLDREKDASSLEMGGWGDLEKEKTAPQQPQKSRLTLNAVGDASCTVTLMEDGDNLPYMLGRAAGCARFLMQDTRVGSNHCYLERRNGQWYVTEKRAVNRTTVNGKLLDPGGSAVLHSGDRLTLGWEDSYPGFLITIEDV